MALAARSQNSKSQLLSILIVLKSGQGENDGHSQELFGNKSG